MNAGLVIAVPYDKHTVSTLTDSNSIASHAKACELGHRFIHVIKKPRSWRGSELLQPLSERKVTVGAGLAVFIGLHPIGSFLVDLVCLTGVGGDVVNGVAQEDINPEIKDFTC